MDKKLKVMQFGCGFTGSLILKNLVHHGADIVAVADISEDKIGKDYGELISTGATGILVSDFNEAEKILKEKTIDICVIATVTSLTAIADIIRLCVRNNCNVITTAEAAHYPFRQYPVLANELDELAKEHNVTISASGVPDVTWGDIIADLAGAISDLKKIEGTCCANLEGYYRDVAVAFGASLSEEEFQMQNADFNNLTWEEQIQRIQEGKYSPNFMWYQNDWLCDKIGLTPIMIKEEKHPVYCPHDFESSTMGRIVKTGEIVGNKAVVTTETKEGISIITQFETKLFGPTESQYNNWKLTGEHEINMSIKSNQEFAMTAASIVNRIPQVINSKAGFIPSSRLGNIKYLVKNNHPFN